MKPCPYCEVPGELRGYQKSADRETGSRYIVAIYNCTGCNTAFRDETKKFSPDAAMTQSEIDWLSLPPFKVRK
jgi:hypothetical protein